MNVDGASVSIITYLNTVQFEDFRKHVADIQEKKIVVAHVEEPLSEDLQDIISGPSEIEGIGRVKLEGLQVHERYQISPIRFRFSKSCPIELQISFSLEFNDNPRKALSIIHSCFKDLNAELDSLLDVSSFRLCVCSLHLADHNSRTLNEFMSDLNLAHLNTSLFKKVLVFKQYSEFDCEAYFLMNLKDNEDELEISENIEKLPIIEKIGNTVKENLEGFTKRVDGFGKLLTDLEKTIQVNDLDKLTKFRIKYLKLESDLLQLDESIFSLKEYQNFFFDPLHNLLAHQEVGLLQNDLRRIRQYYFDQIDRLITKNRIKLEVLRGSIDSGIEVVNTKEVINLGKVNLKFQRWLVTLTIFLFIFTIAQVSLATVQLISNNSGSSVTTVTTNTTTGP